jgi:DNA-binding MarR family transcriptional regulator
MASQRALDRSGSAALERFRSALGIFQTVQWDMPASIIEAFISVALYEGRTAAEHSRLLGVNPQTVHRQLQDLSDQNRFRKDGYDLVKTEPDPNDRRLRHYFLTPKGWRLVDLLQQVKNT